MPCLVKGQTTVKEFTGRQLDDKGGFISRKFAHFNVNFNEDPHAVLKGTPVFVGVQVIFGNVSAGHLVSRGLLNDFGDKKMGVFFLVAEELQFSIIDVSFSEESNFYTAKIKRTVSLSDFVKAKIKNDRQEEKDLHLSPKDEMEPVVSVTIDPAQELSKAYRYLGTRRLRMAFIYLNRLEKIPLLG